MQRELSAAAVRLNLQKRHQFGEAVDLSHCCITGDLRLLDTDICGVDFTGSVFTGSVDFSGSVFQGLSWFKDVRFSAAADFSRTRFSNDARFDRTRFDNRALFIGSRFWGVACFDGTRAEEAFSLCDSMIYGNLSLASCLVSDLLVIDGATIMGGIWMPGFRAQHPLVLEHCFVQGRIEMDSAINTGSIT